MGSRRKFIKNMSLSVASLSTVEIFLQLMCEGLLNKAMAAESSANPNKYILIHQAGAPPRWMYDLFLSPYQPEASNVLAQTSIVSEFIDNAGRYDNSRYKTYDSNGINAPHFWTQSVSDVSGTGQRSVSDLMNNMLVLQGIDTLNPGHGPASKLINKPLTNMSIDGFLADAADKPFGSIAISTVLDFNSEKSSQKQFNPSEDIVSILPKAFEEGFSDIQGKYGTFIEQAVDQLNEKFTHTKLGGRSLASLRQNAYQLMKGELNKIKSSYPTLLAKYEAIISRTLTLSQNVAGFTDQPVGSADPATRSDVYRMRKGNYILRNPDLRSTISSVIIRDLAKQFAITEYVITESLSSTVSFSVNSLLAEVIHSGSSGASKLVTFSTDQHDAGSMASLFYTTIYYRITSACTLALVDALKAKSYKNSNMFDYTVIRTAGEFGRLPRTGKDTGTDHATEASNTMILSGMVKSPVVAGKILKNAPGGTPGKSYGYGGLLESGVRGNLGHIVSSLATMLDVKSPSPNNPSLVTKTAGVVTINEAFIKKTVVEDS